MPASSGSAVREVVMPERPAAERVAVIAKQFRELTIVATHVGGWRQWERAGVLAKCGNVYTETSMTLTEMDDSAFVKVLSAFDEDRVLFGSDSPWTDQKEMVDRTLRLGLPERKLVKLMDLNARTLLGIKAS